MSVRRTLAGAGVLALALTVVVPVGQVEVTANPVTLSETLDGLPAEDRADGAASGGLATAGVDDDADPDTGTDSDDEAGAGTGEDGDPDAVGSSVSELVEAPLTFSAVGFAAPTSAEQLWVRTSEDGESWGSWVEVEFVDPADGPDQGTGEAAQEAEAARDDAGRDIQHSEPLWVSEATHLQLEVVGADVGDVEVTFIDSMGLSGGPVERTYDTRIGTAADASAEIDLITRSQWGADESLGSSTSSTSNVHMGIVHHTAHTTGSAANTYSEAEAPGVMRAMHRYHTTRQGWSDIGYNVVVDRFGNVYEGRKGGFEKGVIGAHARGYNTGSFGVSVMGDFTHTQASSAAIAALTEVIAVKSAIHGVDPGGWTDEMGGSWRPTIVGHRDVGQTVCPGRIHDLLPQIRDNAREMSVRFPDVPASSPHRAPILRLADDGVTTGCRLNEFCPSQGLNRAQASSFVVRALQLTPIVGSQFEDVGDDGAHATSINVLVDRGWLIGRADGTFGPWEEMTRAQLLTLLARAAGLELRTPATDPYPDVPRDSVHAPGIAALKDAGVVGNCGSGNFCPGDVARRDSTASFVDMVRDLRKQEQHDEVDGEEDGEVDGEEEKADEDLSWSLLD